MAKVPSSGVPWARIVGAAPSLTPLSHGCAKLALISQKTKLAEAIRAALSRWEGLTRLFQRQRPSNSRIEDLCAGLSHRAPTQRLGRKQRLRSGGCAVALRTRSRPRDLVDAAGIGFSLKFPKALCLRSLAAARRRHALAIVHVVSDFVAEGSN